MSSVYVLHRGTHNYNAAEKYGKTVFVTFGSLPVFKTDSLIHMIKNGLRDFTENDYLLISGPAIAGILAVSMLFNRFDTVKVLIFDAKQQGYVVRQLTQANL